MVEKEKKVVKRQKGKKNGKGKMGEEEDEDEGGGEFFKSLRAKTTVKPFYNVVHSLSPERKQRVREMGFGTLLGFPYIEFPSKLQYFILKHLDDDTMQVKLPNGGVIEITPSKIREVLGIPMGPMSFFADKKSNSSMLKYHVLENVMSSKDIPNIDWCVFIWNCIKESKEKWDDKTFENWYYGPHVTFTVKLPNGGVIEITPSKIKEVLGIPMGPMSFFADNKSSILKYHVLENVMSSKDIPNVDWCVFIWNCIKESKKKWDDKTLENWYYGPHVTFTFTENVDLQGENMEEQVEKKSGVEGSVIEAAPKQAENMDVGVENADLEVEKQSGEQVENVDVEGEKMDEQLEKHSGEEGHVIEAAPKEVEIQAVKEDALKEAEVEKENAEKVVKEAAEKEQAKKDDAEKARKEAAVKEAAAKEKPEKEHAEKAAKEAEVKKAEAEKKKQQEEKLEEQKDAKQKANKKQDTEKHQKALKLKAVQEKDQNDAQKEANEKRSNEKAEKEVPEYESPSIQEKAFGTGEAMNEKKEGKRIVKPSVYLMSPYNNKMANVMEALTGDERMLVYSLFSMEGYILDNVFDDGHGTIVPRITMQSLSPGVLIDSLVVKEAAEKEQAKKDDAEKARKEAALKEAAAKEKAEKENAEKAAKEAEVKKAEAEKKKQQEEKLEEQKDAKQKANKKQDTEKHQKALKLKAVQEKAQNDAQKEANEKRSNEKAEKEVPEYESPSIQEKAFGTGEAMNEKKEGKRIVKPSVYLKSPYNNKMANVMEALTGDERMLAYSLFSMEGYILDNVFDDGHGTIVPRITMQSLSPGVLIDSLVIDAFISVMNQEERRKLTKERRRYYFPLAATASYLLKFIIM
ncbi:hypothetical protein CTI12_AA486560 [Artemisia annua]|uniref:Uncharacterized protein n=1 Tax=Artemisia annua TaxID=35608 RepID=A0A2U1LHE3_ARTAN|nr:hypothetical protein CTI12_AA486560 [Artemisia annua]